MERVLIRVDGRVQGVGFRWWVAEQAQQLRLTGYAENLLDGRVEISAQGDPIAVGRLVRMVLETPSRTGRPGFVASHTVEWPQPDPGTRGFRCY